MIKKDTLVFIGSSGSGKGTQIKLLKSFIHEKYPETQIIHYDSGAHFRSFVERDGYTSQQMRNILGRGELAPDFITSWLLVNELVTKLTPEKMLILDGFPRTVSQTHIFDSAVEYYQLENVKIIYIEVSPEEVRRRMLLRGREDDKKEKVIEKRIQWYEKNVIPVVEHFRNNKKYSVININGEQDVESVFNEIIKKLNY